MIYYDGSMAIGDFVDGVLHGEGEYWSSDDSTHHKGQFMLGSFVPETYKGEPFTEGVRQEILQARWDHNEELWKEHLSVKYKKAAKDALQDMLWHQHWNIRQKALDKREADDLLRIERELAEYKEALIAQQATKAEIDAEMAAKEEEIAVREIAYREDWENKREAERENERKVELIEDWGNAEGLYPLLELAENDDEEALKPYKIYGVTSKYNHIDLPKNDPMGLHDSEEYTNNHLKWFILTIQKGLLTEGFTLDEMKAQMGKVPSDYQLDDIQDENYSNIFTKLDQDGDGKVAGDDFQAIREWLDMRRDPKMAVYSGGYPSYPCLWTKVYRGEVPDGDEMAQIHNKGFWRSKLRCGKEKLEEMFAEGWEPADEDEQEYFKIKCSKCEADIELGAGFWYGKISRTANWDLRETTLCSSCVEQPQAEFPGL